jgi:hypothetical protein
VRVALLLVAISVALAGCRAQAPAREALPQTELTDARYTGLVFLVASVRRSGSDFIVTNDSTQPWFDVTLTLAGDDHGEYRLHLDHVDAGQSITAMPGQFATSGGATFNPNRDMPRTLIVSAEIGEGGPAGVYAVRL